jgi:CRP/FNR family transcriptional regulator, cyclic AMP receptor protein
MRRAGNRFGNRSRHQRAPKPARRAADAFALLRSHPFFSSLPRASTEQLASYFTKRSVQRGTTIFRKGDAGTELIAILSGSIRISSPAADGREAVLNVIREGEILGEIALLDGRPRTADAIAMSDCELMAIERREFIGFLRKQPEFAFKLIEILCARLRRTSEQVEDLMFLDLPARLAKAIMRLADDTGGPWPRKISLTQRELSQLIGVSRESTNKQLRFWAQTGWIRLERGSIVVIKPDALANVAGTR